MATSSRRSERRSRRATGRPAKPFYAPIDQPLADLLASPTELEPPRLAPEGDFAIVQILQQQPTEQFVPVAIGFDSPSQTWKLLGTFSTGIPTTSYVDYSTPTRGSPRHMLAISVGLGMVSELVGDTTSWTIMDQYPYANFGSLPPVETEPSLTPDGLRLLLPANASGGSTAVYYADRPDVGSRFGTATPLDVPRVDYPMLTEDCSKFYFSALETELELVE